MYQAFYKLTGNPFSLTPDHRFLFQHRGYKEAKNAVAYALDRAEGIGVISGEFGIGKTTLINDVFADLATRDFVVARLEGLQLNSKDPLLKIGSFFGLETEAGGRAKILLELQQCLLTNHRRGRRNLVIIDEAQTLSIQVLREIHVLTNLQINGQALLQLLLIGQEQLWDVLRRPDMEQLHQRIISAYHLKPLNVVETEVYIKHRLCTVGWKGDPAISNDAFAAIKQSSGGIPWQINLLCHQLLVDGFIHEQHELDAGDVWNAVIQLPLQKVTLSQESHRQKSSSAEVEPLSPTLLENSKSKVAESRFLEQSQPNLPFSLESSLESSRSIEPTVNYGIAVAYPRTNKEWFISLVGATVGLALAVLLVVSLGLQKILLKPQRSSSLREGAVPSVSTSISVPQREPPETSSNSESVQPKRSQHQSALAPSEESSTSKVIPLDGPRNSTDTNLAGVRDTPPATTDEASQADPRLVDLLALAEVQMDLKRLSTPRDDNALQTYHKVLQIAPGHEGALKGIARIKAQYTRWAETAMQKTDWYWAQNYLKKALAIEPWDDTLTQQLTRVRAEIKSIEEEAKRTAQKDIVALEKTHTEISQEPANKLSSMTNRIAHVAHEISTTQDPPLVFFRAEITGPVEKAEVFVETQQGFRPHIMYDDGARGDRVAGDGEYGMQINLDVTHRAKHYYIAAYTGEGNLLYSPERPEIKSYVIEPLINSLKSPLVINEFMASNDHTIADAQGGYDDWIELYNATPNAIDLSGYYLSNDPNKLKKWRFPENTWINGHAYLLIWADRGSLYTHASTKSRELHANFRLSRGGDQIFLVDTDASANAILDSVTFGPQREDISTGRIPSGVGEFVTLPKASPGWTN